MGGVARQVQIPLMREHVEERDDIRMPELLKELDLPKSSNVHALRSREMASG